MSADPKQALKTGLLVILLMPSDIIIMLTVGVNLTQNNLGLVAALPFIGATVLIAALPLLLYLLFQRRAAADAEGARLDELEQLAGEHHRLRRVYLAHPLSLPSFPPARRSRGTSSPEAAR